MVTQTHKGRASRKPRMTEAANAEFADVVAMLAHVDVVIWVVEGGYARVRREDLPAIEAFLDGRSDMLSLDGGLLPDVVVNR